MKEDLFDLIQNLPKRTYRDSAEVVIALGEIKSGKKVRNANVVENAESPSKKGGKKAATSVISAATLAKTLSRIVLPQSNENIIKHVKKKYSQDGQRYTNRHHENIQETCKKRL